MNQSIQNKSNREFSMAMMLKKVLLLVAILLAILFIPAGRLDWWQAWLFISIYTLDLLLYVWWGMRNDPDQMKERSKTGENTKAWDKIILMIYSVLLIALFVVAGLDAGRFQWAPVPAILQALGWVMAALACIIIWKTAAVNTYLSRTVRIQDNRGHQVVDRGPYRVVRHPMYAGLILTMFSIPLLLGSLWALLPGALIGILFIIRTTLEDHTLRQELPGYQEYSRRVRYRLLPWVW